MNNELLAGPIAFYVTFFSNMLDDGFTLAEIKDAFPEMFEALGNLDKNNIKMLQRYANNPEKAARNFVRKVERESL